MSNSRFAGLRTHVERDQKVAVVYAAFGPITAPVPVASLTRARSWLAPLRDAIGIAGQDGSAEVPS